MRINFLERKTDFSLTANSTFTVQFIYIYIYIYIYIRTTARISRFEVQKGGVGGGGGETMGFKPLGNHEYRKRNIGSYK